MTNKLDQPFLNATTNNRLFNVFRPCCFLNLFMPLSKSFLKPF